MVCLDDSVGDLEAFCQLLAATNHTLEMLVSSLRMQEEGLAGLEPDLREEIRGATGDAEALEQEIEEAGTGVAKAVHELDQEALDLQDRVAAVDAAAGELDEASSRALGEKASLLETHFEELRTEGFVKLDGELAQERADFAGWWASAQGPLDAFDQSFTVTEEAVGSDAEQTREALEKAAKFAADLEHEVAGIELDGTPVAHLLLYQLPDRLEEQLEQRSPSALERIAEWEQRLEAEAALLQSAAATLGEAAGSSVQEEVRRLDEGMDALLRELELVQIEAAQAAVDLEAAGPVVEAAAALASRIEGIEAKIHGIRQVMAAMETA